MTPTVYFTLTVFGKIVFFAGPIHPAHCQRMLDTYEPPVMTEIVVADGRIVKPEDYRPQCLITPGVMPTLGSFDQGEPT